MEDVVLEQGFHTVNVLLGADVLMGGEISHDVEAASVTEHLLKDRRREIHGIGDVIFRYIHTLCGAKIPGQFRQSVFVVIHHHQRRGLEWQQCLDEAGAPMTSTDFPAIFLLRASRLASMSALNMDIGRLVTY